MPRLICTYQQFIDILIEYGFIKTRQIGSHQSWRGTIEAQVRIVTVSPHRLNENIPSGTLKSMIRQSGLDQDIFRK